MKMMRNRRKIGRWSYLRQVDPVGSDLRMMKMKKNFDDCEDCAVVFRHEDAFRFTFVKINFLI